MSQHPKFVHTPNPPKQPSKGKFRLLGAKDCRKKVGGLTITFYNMQGLESFVKDQWWIERLNPKVKTPLILDVLKMYSDPNRRPVIYCATLSYRIDMLLQQL